MKGGLKLLGHALAKFQRHKVGVEIKGWAKNPEIECFFVIVHHFGFGLWRSTKTVVVH